MSLLQRDAGVTLALSPEDPLLELTLEAEPLVVEVVARDRLRKDSVVGVARANLPGLLAAQAKRHKDGHTLRVVERSQKSQFVWRGTVRVQAAVYEFLLRDQAIRPLISGKAELAPDEPAVPDTGASVCAPSKSQLS